ncbi:hypothetical protein MRBLMN1_002633 [Chitinophaga ginsengisegetis]|uniref:hypothetical protein n=1 Tax=Chitinophaga ginsengisegetis TaxID=393003 RepID=UPI0034383C49
MLLQSTGNCWIVAAFYLNRNYIASELCINRFDLIPVCKGSCFLEKKIKENDKPENTTGFRLKEITLFCQQYDLAPAKPISPESFVTFCDYQSPCFPQLLIRQVFRPPATMA